MTILVSPPTQLAHVRVWFVAACAVLLSACVAAPKTVRSTIPKPPPPVVFSPPFESTQASSRTTKPKPTRQAQPSVVEVIPPRQMESAVLAPTVIHSTPPKFVTRGSSQDLMQRLRRGFQLPTRYHARIDAQFMRYAGQQKYIDELMARASRFIFIAIAEAEQHGVPTELALLPIIESAYDPSATSRSNAAGLWQFIPDTGKLYGLRQTYWFDARRDPLESTRAAYDYLTKLYGMFGDWELVLASYNAGPGTVMRAIERNEARGLNTDYWSLDLPAEAMDYVPRFLAVVSLFKDPISAGVSIPALPNRPYFRTLAAHGPLDLDTVAALSGVSLDELRLLNPGLRRDQLAPDGPYLLHIPNYLDQANERLLVQQSIPSDVRVVNAQGQTEAVVAAPTAQIIRASFIEANSRRYSVRRGDSWYSIARANQLSPKQLALANNDQLSTILSVGRVLVVPTPAAAAYQAHVFKSTSDARATATRDPVTAPSSDTATEIIQAGNRGL